MEEAKEQENRKFMTTEKPLDDKPYVGNLHTAVSQRFGDVDWLDDGNDILATPMCGSLLYKCAKLMLGTLVAIAVAASAMPTPEQTMEAEHVVRELLREDQAALKHGRKTRAEVAESAMSLAGQTESDAAKFLLMKGAYNLYVRAGEFDKAVTTLRGLQAAIPDIPPDRMVSIIEAPLLGVPRRSGGRLRRILDEAKLLARCAREVPELERSLRKTPDDQSLRRSLAEHHACLGRWGLALENFAVVEGRLGDIAKAERDGSVDAAAAADFWWRYPSGKEEQERYFRAHAATLYEKAIASGALSGLDKVLAERRIAEAKEGDLFAERATAKRPEATTGNAARIAAAAFAGRLYCVVDLSAGPNASKYPVSYLTEAPKDGWTDEYKTTKLVLRRIEPGTFIMGENQKYESHRVTLTKPFYIGVFEVTQKQYALVTGDDPSAFKGDMRPVEMVSYEMIRGNDEGARWPSSSAVDTYSFMGKLRARTGLDFDLPTEAQWEYACRAGTKSTYNNGGDFEDNLKRLGRFVFNQKSRGWWESDADFARHRPDGKGGHSNHHTVVGSYLPNAWGLYDMHGNVHEWCLDWYGELSYGTDPIGVSSSADRVVRGGSWLSTSHCRAASRNKNIPRRGSNDWGFRLAVGHATPTRPSGAAQPTGDVASKNLVRNGSFEADPVKDGDYAGSTPITGWSKDGSVGLIRKNTRLSWKQRYDATTRCFINTGASIKQTINVSRRMNCSVSLNKASMNFFNNGKKFYPSSGYVKIDDMVVISGLATPGGHTKSFTVTVELTPGSHTLKISCTGGRGMSIDDVKVVLAP